MTIQRQSVESSGVRDKPIARVPKVVVVILNTNRREDTLECLSSMAQSTYTNLDVLVLDNHSVDGSVAAIREKHAGVSIVELRDNRGYAGNNNVGIESAIERGADWIFILNEDTVLAPDCVARLIEIGESDSRIGVLGPMVYHDAFPETIQSAGGVLTYRWEAVHLGCDQRDDGQFVEPHPVDWISGCGILVRRGVVEEVGGLDDRFFYYWEETEWCIRAAKAGWRIVHVPQARMWHKGVTVCHEPKPSVTYYAARNRLLALSKHRAAVLVRLSAWAQLTRTLVSWSVKRKWRHRRLHRDALMHGMIDYLRGRWGACRLDS